VEVDATAPAGTATVRSYALYVGNNQDGGSIFFDDLNLYQPSTTTTNTVATAPGVQIAWPTSPPTNGIDYQLQSIPSLVFSNPPAVNVCSNGGFEGGAAPWITFNGAAAVTSNAVNPVRTGSGSMKLATVASVPGCFQNTATLATAVVTPGQVWSLQGYGYNSSTTPMHSAATRALLKIVWDDSTGAAIAPVSSDPNLIGSLDAPPNYGIVSSPQMTGASPQNTWTFLVCQGTAPSNAVSVSMFCLLVPSGNGGQTETAFFDDLSFFQPVGFNGWVNFGPLWLGNGQSNQTVDAFGTNATKFYRMTTP